MSFLVALCHFSISSFERVCVPSIKRLCGTGPCGDFNLEQQCEIATSFQECGPKWWYLFFNDERDLLLAISMGILFKLCLHGIGILFWITYPSVHYPKEIDILLRSNDFSWQAFINKTTHLWYYVMPIIYSNILGPLWLEYCSLNFFGVVLLELFLNILSFFYGREESRPI